MGWHEAERATLVVVKRGSGKTEWVKAIPTQPALSDGWCMKYLHSVAADSKDIQHVLANKHWTTFPTLEFPPTMMIELNERRKRG